MSGRQLKGSDKSYAGGMPNSPPVLAPLDRLRYELELVQEEMTALQIEQEAAFAGGGEVKRMVHLARRAAELRARHSRVRQEILRTERLSPER